MSFWLNILILLFMALILSAIAGLLYFGYLYLKTKEGKKLVAETTGMEVAEPVDEEKMLPTDHLPSDALPEEQLEVVEPGQVIAFVKDLGGDDHAVQANMTLQPMTKEQFGQGRWVPKKELPSQAIWVGGEWIFRVPSSESGKHIWLKGEILDTPTLVRFYKGTEDNPGPAKKFKLLGQDLNAEEIVYQLPNQLTPDTKWRIHDIGAFEISVKGDTNGLAVDGDFVYFVTSKEKEGENWLFFLDARNKAVGTGGLFLCEPFNPSEEIKRLF